MPASLSLGQHGVYKEYDQNGQISLMTYLDDDGLLFEDEDEDWDIDE